MNGAGASFLDLREVGERHLAPHAPDVLARVHLGRLQVALDHGLVDHPVLGDVDLHPAGLRERVVAQAPPQRLVHPLGDLLVEADHHGVVGHPPICRWNSRSASDQIAR